MNIRVHTYVIQICELYNIFLWPLFMSRRWHWKNHMLYTFLNVSFSLWLRSRSCSQSVKIMFMFTISGTVSLIDSHMSWVFVCLCLCFSKIYISACPALTQTCFSFLLSFVLFAPLGGGETGLQHFFQLHSHMWADILAIVYCVEHFWFMGIIVCLRLTCFQCNCRIVCWFIVKYSAQGSDANVQR